MRCAACGHENRDTAKFCEECAGPLKRVCVGCGSELRPTAKFCDACGAEIRGLWVKGLAARGETEPLSPSPVTPNPLAVATASRPAPAAVPSARELAAVPPAPPRPRHRLAAVDWLLLGTLLPLCVFGLVMTVVHGVRSDFVRLPFAASSAPDEQSYPIVRRVLSSPSAEAGSVAVGDRLLRLEGSELRGLSWAALFLRWSAASQTARSLLLTIERGGVHSDIRVPLPPGYVWPGSSWWAPLPLVLSFVGTALLLIVRAAHWHLARRTYVVMLLFAIYSTPYFASPTAPRIGIVNDLLVLPLVYGLMFWSFCEFIPGTRWNPWQRAVAWALAILLSASFAAAYWLPDAGLAAVLMRSNGLAHIGCIIAVLVALTQVYRRSEPLGRRQVKWVVYGCYVGSLPSVLYQTASSLGTLPEWTGGFFLASYVALLAIPLGFLVAIAFYQFLDIDRLFSATLSYSVLAILGLALVLGVMPAASQAVSDVLGIAPGYGQILFAFALAAIVVPAQRLVRPRIDRLLFPQRLALEQGFEHLLAALSGCADMQELTRLVGERLDALLQPAAAVVYARAGDVFTPLAVRGRTAPPAFAAQSTLITALQERTTPLAAERWTARQSTSLTPFERAAIETLEVAVLVPFRRGADLIAFVCLGPKRSGDIYTPTDLAWLGAVAGKVSDRLLALDATAVAEQARAMQEALRRYVPGAVAARLASGQDIEAGEREVTVLFVDIRGYTGFSEARQAEEIFHTVNRYTEMVSQLVRARGGSVVEFHGDGLLAVFGAPDEIPMKERAAVQVGCEIVAAMAAMAAPGANEKRPQTSGLRPQEKTPDPVPKPEVRGPAPTLSVGVGIGTGPAFVGNIQSSDRFIWTVIGDTVNLAARLQSMTRELNAAVAIDDTTYRRAGRETCAAFVRHADLAIRGRAQPETVHALPL